MQISVKSDVDKALKSMRGLQRKQVPFAAALGLSMTAKKVAQGRTTHDGAGTG